MKDFCVFCGNQDFEVGYITPNPRERVFIICIDHYKILNKLLDDSIKIANERRIEYNG